MLDLAPLVATRASAYSAFLFGLQGYIFAIGTVSFDLKADGIRTSFEGFGYLPNTVLFAEEYLYFTPLRVAQTHVLLCLHGTTVSYPDVQGECPGIFQNFRFIEVSESRAAQDAINYSEWAGSIPSSLLSDEREAWYSMLPAGFKDRTGHDPKESTSSFFLERAEETKKLEGLRHLTERVGARTEAAAIAKRIAARSAASLLMRAVVDSDIPFGDWMDGFRPSPGSIVVDYDEGTPQSFHSILLGKSQLESVLGIEPDQLADANGRWFYSPELGVYAQAVYPPEPTSHLRRDLAMAGGSEAAADDALHELVQLNAFVGAAAMKNYPSK